MVYKLKPNYFNKIWGGSKLREIYKYDCNEFCGEAWGISGHKNAPTVILNGEYKGKTIKELYREKKELFGYHPSKEFPILVKVIDAKNDLSIQVHPGDEYAKKYHDSFGKTECWYILDAQEDTQIIIGHNKTSIEEIKTAIESNDYESMLNKYSIQKGDMFLIKSGTIHAICQGTVLLEVQQSSDITYRFYDYNRLENGLPRELHIDKALDVINIPDNSLIKDGQSDYFSVNIISPENKLYEANQYGDYYFVISGSGSFDELGVEKGDFLFIPSKNQYHISGDLEVAKIEILSK